MGKNGEGGLKARDSRKPKAELKERPAGRTARLLEQFVAEHQEQEEVGRLLYQSFKINNFLSESNSTHI